VISSFGSHYISFGHHIPAVTAA